MKSKIEMTIERLHSSRLAPLLPGAAFGIIFALVFHRFFGSVLFHRDAHLVYIPLKSALVTGLSSGHLGWWDPGQYLGAPRLGAVENGLFYPLNLIYLVLPLLRAHNLFTLIHYPIAAAGMYALLGRFGLKAGPRGWGAIIFSLSGYIVSMHCNMIFITGLAWAPLALYFIDRAHEEGYALALAAGAVLALQVLAGAPQDALLTSGMVAVWILAKGSSRPAGLVRSSGLLAVTAAAAVLLCLFQLIPALEYTHLSYRSEGISWDKSTAYSMNPVSLVEFLWATPWGTYWPTENFWGQAVTSSLDQTPWSESLYFGLAPLLTALVGLGRGPRGRRLLIGGGLLLFVLMAFGRYTPVFGWLYEMLPPLRLFRFPMKYLAYFTLCLALAAALGAQQLLDDWKLHPSHAVRDGGIYLALSTLLGAAYLLAWPKVLQLLGTNLTAHQFTSAASHLRFTGWWWLAANWALGALTVVAGRGLLTLRNLSRLAFALLVIDLYLANVTIIPGAPPELYEFTPLAKNLIAPEGPPPGAFRIFRVLPFSPPDTVPRRDRQPLLRAAAWQRNTLTPNLDVMEGFEDLSGYGPLKPREGLRQLLSPTYLEFRLFNVEYLITSPDVKIPDQLPHEEVSVPDQGFKVIKLTSVRPRTYFVSHALTAPDEQGAVKLLGEASSHDSVVLTTKESIPPTNSPPLLVPASIDLYEPDRVEVEVKAPTPGWLVLSDRNYPGWRATVDGKPRAIFTANVMVRAVPVKAGNHRVVFTYHPSWFGTVLSISLLAWLAALLVWARAWRGGFARPGGPQNPDLQKS